MMNTQAQKPLVLIDGSSYLYRAFHALPPLTNSKGVPTGAVYGVINMIRKLRSDVDPDYMAVIFDPKGKTFRNDLYPEYKANRPEMPDELRVQIKPLHDVIKAMGLPLIVVDGVEADDVIGTLTKAASDKGMTTLISTGDKDMAQLVDENVRLINTMSGKELDEQGVKEKFGVSPAQIIDYLALMGDTSDNVPGVPKVGPKTAAKWLAEYQSLDDVMKNADQFKGKIGENLRNSLAHLPLSKELVTIRLDVPVGVSVDELKPKESEKPVLIDLFKELEFRRWLDELLGEKDVSGDEKNYETLLTEKDFLRWLEKLKAAKLFSFDTETTSLQTQQAEIVGVSFATQAGEAAYVPVAHDYENAPAQLNRGWVLKQLKPLLQDKNNTVVGQNLKYDCNVLKNYDIEITAPMRDTMLASYVLNSSSSRHDMDSLALKYLGKRTIHFEDVAGKGAKQLTFNQIPLEQAAPYAAEDADITLQLYDTLWPQIQKDKKLKKVMADIELPLMPVLAKMERNGVLIDAEMLAVQSGELAKRISELESQAYTMADQEFNLGSPKQLQEVLYDKLNLPVLSKTPKGAPSTAEPALQELAIDYPLPKVILEYRSLSKLKSTYTDSLPKQIDPNTGRVHTSYNQAVTATGRLSSTDPNLQNIPIRSEEGRRIRQAFVAAPGHKIIASDYSQVELRIMAHLTQDEGLLKAFAEGLDIHKATAAEVFGVSVDKVSSNQRRNAKAINFGLIYGMSAYGLSRQLGVERKVAQEYMDMYFQRYPGIKNYMDQTRELAHDQGFVETIFGRKLYLPEINASNLQRQRAAERAAINAPMQGTAADIIKLAMIKMEAWLDKNDYDAKMIMQVHDELVFEVADRDVNVVAKQVNKIMTTTVKLSVPLVVDMGMGDNWGQAH